MPARANGIDHAHRLHSGGVARGAAQEHGRAAVDVVRLLQFWGGYLLSQHAEEEHHQPADNRNHAKGRMQDENQNKINGHPRHVEKRKHRVAAQKTPQGLHIADFSLVRSFLQGGRAAQFPGQNRKAQLFFKLHADFDEQARAYPFQTRQRHQGNDCRNSDDDQRRKEERVDEGDSARRVLTK